MNILAKLKAWWMGQVHEPGSLLPPHITEAIVADVTKPSPTQALAGTEQERLAWLGCSDRARRDQAAGILAFVFDDDTLVSVTYRGREHTLPPWAVDQGWATPEQAWRWENPWQWPGRPWYDGRAYRDPAPAEPQRFDIQGLATPRPAPELDKPLPPEVTNDLKIDEAFLLERDAKWAETYLQPSKPDITERAALSADEHALFEQLAPDDPSKVVELPPATKAQAVRDWVDRRIGFGEVTPADLNRQTDAPLGGNSKFHLRVDRGFSMSYLRELLNRANAMDETLSDEDLLILRSRGLL